MKFLKALKRQAQLDAFHKAAHPAQLVDLAALDAGKMLKPGVLGPNSIEKQVADGVALAMASIPKEDPGTVYKAMKMLHDLGFFVTSATTHTAAQSIPEMVITFQQPDVDKLMVLVEHCSGKVHYPPFEPQTVYVGGKNS